MAYDIITITPAVQAAGYVQHDTLFVSTAVNLPHRSCKILSATAVVDNATAASDEITLLFFKENTNNIGPINEDLDISATEIKANVFLGANRLVAYGETELNTPSLFASQHHNDTDGPSTNSQEIVLVEGSTKNTCYVQGYIAEGAITPDATDDLVITLHVEY
tara:strand:+ start:203 stop:691 length:489 start_codon:yes stop_codon:yes gene_type:complete